MQKILLIVAIVGVNYAQELTSTEANKLRNYNHSLSGKIRHKRLLERTAIVTKEEAYRVAKEACESQVNFSKLSVRSNRLFYTLYTDKGMIKIDALDNKIMEECKR
jgi:hypothetical protein